MKEEFRRQLKALYKISWVHQDGNPTGSQRSVYVYVSM